MRALELFIGLMVIAISAKIFHFTYHRVQRLDRKMKLYIGAFLLAILGICLMLYGFDLK